MKKILSVFLYVALAFAANAQFDVSDPIIICGAGESCPPNVNGHFSSGVFPYEPDVNSGYFPTIRTCEPLDMCITMHCPQTIDLSAVNSGSGTITLRGVEVKGFGGLPEGVSYCLSDANWQPDGYYTIHLTGTPTQSGTFQLKLRAVLSSSLLSINTDTFYPNGMDFFLLTVDEGTPPEAGFIADAFEITAGNAVNFTNTSTGYQATRTWTFEGGNPTTSTEENPRVVYSTPGTYQVSLTVTNACGEEDTRIETSYITVRESYTPNIIVQPQDIEVCSGVSYSISLVAEGDNLRYSWYRNGEYIGYNSPTYTSSVPYESATYYCVVQSEYGGEPAYSDTVTVTVVTTPIITWQPTPHVMALCEGEEYELTMAATGDAVHYQWYNNGNAIPDQTSNNLHIDHVTRANSGQFYCIVSNACA